MAKALPSCRKSNTEVDPRLENLATPAILMELPHLANDRNDKELPTCTKSTTDMLYTEPMRPNPNTDTLEPTTFRFDCFGTAWVAISVLSK